MKRPPVIARVVIARVVIAAALLAGLCVVLDGCSEPEPVAEQRLLVIDGIEIRFDELAPYVEFLQSFRPEAGRKTMFMLVLREYILPLRLAERAFATERAAKLEEARALQGVATNIHELEQQSSQITTKRRSNLRRTKAQLPVAMFLFDPMRTGSVSEPIAVPQGWFLVGAYDLQDQGPLALGDSVDALQVGFVTHKANQWSVWHDAEKLRIADKVTFVHPDYRDSLPGWMHPPKKP